MANEETKEIKFTIKRLYVKDSSFESPQSPKIFNEINAAPKIDNKAFKRLTFPFNIIWLAKKVKTCEFNMNSVFVFDRNNYSFHGVEEINIEQSERNLFLVNFYGSKN